MQHFVGTLGKSSHSKESVRKLWSEEPTEGSPTEWLDSLGSLPAISEANPRKAPKKEEQSGPTMPERNREGLGGGEA